MENQAIQNKYSKDIPLLVLNLKRSQFTGLLGLCMFAAAPWIFFMFKHPLPGFLSLIPCLYFALQSLRMINQQQMIFLNEQLVVERVLGKDLLLKYTDMQTIPFRIMASLLSADYVTLLRIGNKNRNVISRQFNDITLNLRPLYMEQAEIDKLLAILKDKTGLSLPDHYSRVGGK